MPATDWGWLITPDELRQWTLLDTPNLFVVNKPALVVCHPSKHGPWSSLIGASREYLGLERLHMPSRLDRETSGVVVMAKDRATASRLQKATQCRQVRKTYYAILTGTLSEPTTVDQPIARDVNSPVVCRQWVVEGGQEARTEFRPLAHGGGYTLAQVLPHTGRLHQIRVHAAWLGHAVAGDKLYGPDATLMLEFVAHGFTPRLQAMLPLPRHALHAADLAFDTELGAEVFQAPLAPDLVAFCRDIMGLPSI